MNARIGWALVACLGLVGCVDTGAESWCEDHDAICKTTVSTVEPAEGPITGGTALTIRGAALEAGGDLFLGGNRLLNVVYKSRNEVQATSPIGVLGPAVLKVVNLNGEFEFPGKFTYRAPSVVQSVIPQRAPKWGGTQVTVQGSDFYPGTRLFLADHEVLPVTISPDRTTLTGTAPPHGAVGDVPLRLEGPGGTVLVTGLFRYVAWERRTARGLNDFGGVRWMARGGSPEVYYVGTSSDLYRSDNGLDTWTRVLHPAVDRVARDTHLVVDRLDGQRVYFASDILFRSNNGGMSWLRTELTENGQPTIIRALAQRATDGRLFAASDQSLFFSDNQGASFTRLSGHTVTSVRQLRVHPLNPDAIHLMGHQGLSALSTNGGLTFSYFDTQEVSVAEPGLGADEFWYGTHFGELRQSWNLGLTWSIPPETSPAGSCLAFHANPATARYALSDFQQVFELDPSGSPVAWNSLLQLRDVHALLSDSSGRLIMAGGGGVVRRDTPTGNAFSPMHQGMESPWLQALAQDGLGLYAGTRSGRVAFSRDQGRTWEDRGAVSGFRGVTSLAVVPEAGQSVLYALVEGGDLFRQAPGGPWSQVVDPTGAVISGSRLKTQADSGLLYLIDSFRLLRKEPDGGWSNDGTGLGSGSAAGVVARFDGANLQLYTVLGGGGLSSQAYTRPAAGTNTWTPVGNLVPETFGFVPRELVATPNALVALVGDSRVARMPFDTQIWELLPENAAGYLRYSKYLFTAPAPSQTVYAGSEFSLLRSDDSGVSWRPQVLETYGGAAVAGLVDRNDLNLVFLPASSSGLVLSQTGGE